MTLGHMEVILSWSCDFWSHGGYHYHDHVNFHVIGHVIIGRSIEVNTGLCKPLFKQSEVGILVGGMTIFDVVTGTV